MRSLAPVLAAALFCGLLVHLNAQSAGDADISTLLKNGQVEEAVETVAKSSDAKAWKELQDWLLSPDSRDVVPSSDDWLDPYAVEIRAKGFTEEKLYRRLAEGDPKLAAAMFVSIEERMFKNAQEGGSKYASMPVYYHGIARLQKPTEKVMGLLKLRIEQSGTKQQYVDDRILAHTLAVMNTRESADLLVVLMAKSKDYGWDSPYRFDQELFGRNRQCYEICRMVLDHIKSPKGKGKQALLDMLFANKFVPVGGNADGPECTPLPVIAPKGEDAEKYIKLLTGFLKDSGSYQMTEPQRRQMHDLVERIRAGASGS